MARSLHNLVLLQLKLELAFDVSSVTSFDNPLGLFFSMNLSTANSNYLSAKQMSFFALEQDPSSLT